MRLSAVKRRTIPLLPSASAKVIDTSKQFPGPRQQPQEQPIQPQQSATNTEEVSYP